MIPKIENNGTFFRIWAPNAPRITLRILEGGPAGDRPLENCGDGFHQTFAEGVGPGTVYQYLVGDHALPDPASLYQPYGAHGPSMLVDFGAHEWADQRWGGVAPEDLVLYEIHIGTFTETGTYLAAIDRLDDLVALGATAVELMPLAHCPGKWNWGYDGVHLFAPNSHYGTPAELCQFIDACHQRGLAVLHDVVYNHLGPEGNYLGFFAPYFGEQRTPWGECPDFNAETKPQVREFFRENARFWIEYYHFDGLRFDTITAINDPSPKHIINEIGRELHSLGETLGRRVLAIGESNLYQPEFLRAGGGSLDALWSDDLGHAALASVTNERVFGGRNYAGPEDFARALEIGYLYQRGPGGGMERAPDDTPAADLATCVHQIQNHDIVGNSPGGYRIHQAASPEVQRALASLLLLYPAIPLIFMGEDFSADAPFHFFNDFGNEKLRRKVVRGRRREFPQHDWSRSVDPTDPEAFFESRVPPLSGGDSETRRWYHECLLLRKEWKRLGLFSQENLEIRADPASQTYLFNYRKEGLAAYVAARLAPAKGTVWLSGAETVRRQTGPVETTEDALGLGPAGTALGEGTLRFRS